MKQDDFLWLKKRACIASILARLRSSISGSFRAAQNPIFQVVWV